MIKQWFITGTDTSVGKTIVSILLLKKAGINGFMTAGYKPIASGCIKTIHGLQNNDALLLKRYSTVQLKYTEVNPYPFHNPVPPNFFRWKKNINFDQLSFGLSIIQKKSNWIIIEGIGGWSTPIFQKKNLSDWLKMENIPVILVVSIKLGCINHAILTAESICKSGLKFAGWFANCTYYEKYLLNYIYTIKQFIKSPFLGVIPYINDIKQINKYNINILMPQ